MTTLGRLITLSSSASLHATFLFNDRHEFHTFDVLSFLKRMNEGAISVVRHREGNNAGRESGGERDGGVRQAG